MIRVHIICEGQTEESFVNEVLVPHFLPLNIVVRPSLIGKPGHKGGCVSYKRLKDDVKGFLYDRTSYITCFFDFYGMDDDMPGKLEALSCNGCENRQKRFLDELNKQLVKDLGSDILLRFIPYVQMYEFEGLLFSDVACFSKSIGRLDLEADFQAIRERFSTPEEINNSPETAPGKRIVKLMPEYDKPLHGTLATVEMGLDIIRVQCVLFDAWLNKLEQLQNLAIV